MHVSNAAIKWQGHGIENICRVTELHSIVDFAVLFWLWVHMYWILGDVNWVAQARTLMSHSDAVSRKAQRLSGTPARPFTLHCLSRSPYIPYLCQTLCALISSKNLLFTIFMTCWSSNHTDNKTAWNQLQASGWLEISEIQLRKTSRQ